MNIKKLFATLAGVSLFATTVVPSCGFAATYSEELQGAYNWAHENGITTMATIDNANMYGAITRAEMAKMLANYAKNLMGREADASAACSFTDTASVQGDLATAIVEACQLGIMGQGISAFRPYDTISRAEFGTALSRLLWGTEYEGGTPYYAKHLDALKAAGIMTQIANAESTKEVRGYVMLMLQRASGLEADDSECDDPMVTLVCNADPENALCPEACRPSEPTPVNPVVKAGDLAVSATANKGASVISNGATSELDTLTFRVSETITLKSVTLERYGLSKYNTIAAIRLEDAEGNKVTQEKTISASKDTVTLNLKKDYQSIEEETSFIIVVRTPDGTAADTNIGFKVISVESSAENLNLSNYSANLYDIINYTGNDVTVTNKGSNKSYNYEEGKFYEVAKVKVAASNAAVKVNGFTLTQSESATMDLDEYIDDVEVSIDGTTLKNVSYSTKRDELRVSFDEKEISINKSATFTVSVSLKEYDEFGSTINLFLENASDLNVVESKNNVRVSVKKPLPTFAVYTFKGGKITLSNTKLSSSIDAAAGSNEVVIAQGKITLGGQAVRLDSLKFDVVDAEKYVSSLKLVIGDEEYEADATYKVEDIVIDEDATIKILVDLNETTKEEVTAATINVSLDGIKALNATTLASIKYDDVSNSIAGKASEELVGSISISSIKVQPSKASLTNNLTKKAEFRVNETTTKTVFDGTYTAKQNDVHLNKVTIEKREGTLDSKDNITFHVYVDGSEVASIDGADYYDFSEVVVEAGKSVSVKVDAEVFANKETASNLKYRVTFEGVDDSNAKAGVAYKDMMPMAFVNAESITTSTNNTMKKADLVLAEDNQLLAKFIVRPANKSESATLDNLVFDLGDSTDSELFKLVKNSEGSSYTSWGNVNLDEYFDIVVDGTSVNTIEGRVDTIASKQQIRLFAEDLNKEIKGDTTVELYFRNTLVNGDYSATIAFVNANDNDIAKKVSDSSIAKAFTRKSVDTLVRVATQAGDEKTKSTYTFDIDYASDSEEPEVTKVVFFKSLAGVDNDDVISLTAEDAADDANVLGFFASVTEGEEYTITNNTEAHDVLGVAYVAGDEVVILDYDTYSDYFKVGGDYLTVFSKKN